jgi:Methyltransferase domain
MKFPEREGNFIRGLYDMLKYIGNTKRMTIIEIGTWTGCATEIFCQNFKSVITIDPFNNETDWFSKKYDMQKVYEFAKQRLSKYNNITIIRDYSYNVKNISADIVYIDGSHEYENVKRDSILYLDRAKLFIAGHDYHNKFPGVIAAINEILGKPEKVFKDTSWIFKKDKIKGIK